MRCATSAAAQLTTPSSSTGVRRAAASRRKPDIAAMSAPPTVESSATGSPCTDGRDASRRAPRRPCASRCRRRCRCRAHDGRRVAAVEDPDDRGGRGRVADAHVARHQQVGAGVDLPRRRWRSRGERAREASSRVRASPRSIEPEPRRTLWRTTSSGSVAPEVGVVDVDGHVDHAHGRAVVAREHVHRRRRRRGS